MTPDLDALAALLAAAISSALEATFGPPADGISTALRRAVVDHAVNGFRPSLIETARREAGLQEALERLTEHHAEAECYRYPECERETGIARSLLHDNAGVALPADMERPETLALLFLIADCVVQMAEKASPDAGRRRAQLTRAAEMMDARLASADEEGGTR